MQENQPNNTDGAAAQAIAEQQHGDEFNPAPSPNAVLLLKELQELEEKASQIYSQMFQPMQGKGAYKGPDYLQRERMQLEMAQLESRAMNIRHELNGLAAQMGPTQS